MTKTLMRWCALVAALSLVPCAGRALAGVLVDQSSPGGAGFFSDVSFPQAIADNFILSSAAAPDSIEFWGVYYTGNTPLGLDILSLAFYDNASGLPGALITSVMLTPSRVATGGIAFGSLDVYKYSASFDSVDLAAGTYWLSVVNESGADTSNQWIWLFSLSGFDLDTAVSSEASRTPTSWIGTGPDMAFVLSESVAAVPEPSTLISVCITGLIGFAWRCRAKATN